MPNDFQTCSALTIGSPERPGVPELEADLSPVQKTPGSTPAFLLEPLRGPLLRGCGLLVAEALAEVRLQVVLADGEQRREEDVPDAGHDQQRHDLEVLGVRDR